MTRTATVLFVSLVTSVPAQDAGLRVPQGPPAIERLGAPPDIQTAERLITVEAIAEVRLRPSQVRAILSASATAATAPAAHVSARELVSTVRQRLVAAGVEQERIDVDFIAAIPVYAWQVETRDGRQVLAERREGTRVQYNLYVATADEASARVAAEAAGDVDGVELLGVDYWSDRLDAARLEAQQKALAKAKERAALLLAALDLKPRPINVHECTRVVFPQDLYRVLQRSEDTAAHWYDRELPRVPLTRPMTVYYHGLFGDFDVSDATLPGRREIEVISTVRLYYEAPGRSEATQK